MCRGTPATSPRSCARASRTCRRCSPSASSACRFAPAGCEALRVYLRDPAQLALARGVLAGSGIPDERIAWLHGDVCRRELDVELEGVFAAT